MLLGLLLLLRLFVALLLLLAGLRGLHALRLGSALFVTPFLVLLSAVFVASGMEHAKHLDLLFTPLEVVAVLLCVLIVAFLGINGETNWFEGVLLLALYAVLGIVFFYIPATAATGH